MEASDILMPDMHFWHEERAMHYFREKWLATGNAHYKDMMVSFIRYRSEIPTDRPRPIDNPEWWDVYMLTGISWRNADNWNDEILFR